MTRTAFTDALPRRLALAVGAVAALAMGGCTTSPNDLQFGTPLVANLEGENEVPQEGDPNGTGRFDAALERNGELCYELFATGIAQAQAAHIHRGAASENGPPVVTLATPQMDRTAEGCTMIEPALASEMLGNPENFYVNVHNEPYPGGAIRGPIVAVE
ncbi:CHRD domain-containing protein [Erythrobacter sp.]|uniref:CHRD domain-containing protein n=1 Tax=Erythrobacter sp. TaxID=1042 RepID=UPI001425ECC7|nr:CHRD domain-containing protein [Erythrobacter sp.]QIQ85798.1 MAG: CHRD domain-containing protein [Erythrobacter sp.]